jgi:hypothetical protein
VTPEIAQRIERLKAALARSNDATAVEDVAALFAALQRLEADLAVLEHAFTTTCADRDLLLAHLGGRRPWTASNQTPAAAPFGLSRMLDDLAASESLAPDDLIALGSRLEAGDAKTMSAADWRAISLISERLIAAEDDSLIGEASLAQANNVSQLINFWKNAFDRGAAVDAITLTELLRQKLSLLTRCTEPGHRDQCLAQIEALLLNLGLGDRYMDEAGTARRAMQNHARQTGLAATNLEIIDLGAHNRSIGILSLLDYYLRAKNRAAAGNEHRCVV